MEAREEAGDMKRYFGAAFSVVKGAEGGDPAGHFADFIFAVVLARDDQSCQFHVTDADGVGDHFHDHLAVAAEDIYVIMIGEALEVDVHGVDVGRELAEDVRGGGAVGDNDIFHAVFVDEFRRVADEFPSDEGLVVGEGDADIAPLFIVQCCVCQFLRRDFLSRRGELHRSLRPRNLMVLAKRAAQIAAITADGQDHAARMEAGERLFLDRVEGEGRDLPVVGRGDEPVFAGACAAEAEGAFGDFAVPETYVAFWHGVPPVIRQWGQSLLSYKTPGTVPNVL